MPGGRESNAIVFVEDYNVFYIPDVGSKAKRVFPISGQKAAVPEVVIHGVPDWIYEEDILKAPKALWPSEDGKRIVYATFDDSEVEEVRWQVYKETEEAGADPYPKVETMRYPKVNPEWQKIPIIYVQKCLFAGWLHEPRGYAVVGGPV